MLFLLIIVVAISFALARFNGLSRSIELAILIIGALLAVMLIVSDTGTSLSLESAGLLALNLAIFAVLVGLYSKWLRSLRSNAKEDEEIIPEYVLSNSRAKAPEAYLNENSLKAGENGFDWSLDHFSLECRIGSRTSVARGDVEIQLGRAEIKLLRVHPELRAQGYGSSLLARLEKEAASRGASTIAVSVFDWQVLGFFEKFGYQKQSTTAYPAGATQTNLSKELT